MLTPRGSFACVALPDSDQILVAGGGSRHTMFAAAGNRTRSVEMYDISKDEWVAMDGLPSFRAGCVGFLVGNESEDRREFWVVGGYGASRTISGIFPVDEYCRDAAVMELKNGSGRGQWREVGNIWREGERMRFGKIVVVENENGGCPGVFMLDRDEILRYDVPSSYWLFESRVPRKAPCNSSLGFVVLDGELYVMTNLNAVDVAGPRRNRRHKRGGTLYFQIYHPKKKMWRSLVTKSPFDYPVDINAAVLSSVTL